MRLFGFLLGALLLNVGCGKHQTKLLGKPPNGVAQTIDSIRTVHPGTAVVLKGIMIEKCPVAGCWFRLRDNTGTIKVDTRSAGFVVARVPVNSRLLVSGKLVSDGSDIEIEALGLTY